MAAPNALVPGEGHRRKSLQSRELLPLLLCARVSVGLAPTSLTHSHSPAHRKGQASISTGADQHSYHQSQLQGGPRKLDCQPHPSTGDNSVASPTWPKQVLQSVLASQRPAPQKYSQREENVSDSGPPTPGRYSPTCLRLNWNVRKGVSVEGEALST